ncbi:serine hydrolase domain-containing protein, partial [Pseudomonas aeruginosa]
LAEALRQRVGIPAGMRDSGFLCADAQRLAAVYVSDRPRPRRMAERETVTPFEDCVGIRFEPRRAFEPSAYASGGAGMIGSAGDVLRLLEVLRQGGAPLLTPGLVEEMGRDQVPGLELPANPGFGFGLGFSVLRDPAIAQSPESPGTWRWGGAYGHSWFVDRARELSVVALTNTLFEGMSGRFVNDLRDAVYRSAELR